MITNDYIKGYLAALRSVQTVVESMKLDNEQDEEITEDIFEVSQGTLEVIENYVKEQRNSYKQIVDELNAEAEKK